MSDTATVRIGPDRVKVVSTGAIGPPGPPGAPDPQVRADLVAHLAAKGQAGGYAPLNDLARLPVRQFTAGVAGFSDLIKPTITAAPVRPVSVVYGVMWGRTGNDLHRWDPATQTWSLVLSLPAGEAPTLLLEVGGAGEIMLARNKTIWRSTGWANPATATFAQVLDGTLESYFLPYSVATAGDLVMATEYGQFADSRRVWLSQDGGATFASIFDLATVSANPAHLHIAAIDTFHDGPNPRLWTSWHADPAVTTLEHGVLYSDDLGQTWTTIDTVHNPTAAVATPHGMVFGSDDSDDGIFRVLRTANPADMRYERIQEWRPSAQEGLHGFAMRAVYDESTQTAYIGYTVSQPGNTSAIFATDGLTATEVWTHPTLHATGLPNGVRTLMVLGSEVVAHVMDNGVDNYMLRGGTSRPFSAPPLMRTDPGRVRGGTAHKTSVAVGLGSDASGLYTTVFGGYAKAGQFGVALGRSANAGVNPGAVAIGRNAAAPASDSIAIGHGAVISLAGAAGAVSIGKNASSGNTDTVAVGQTAVASGFEATALGGVAQATVGGAVALGRNAKATNVDSVALGRSTQTTAAFQVAVGPRHVELHGATAPGAPAAGRGRVYVEAGALRYVGGAGTVTTLAPA